MASKTFTSPGAQSYSLRGVVSAYGGALALFDPKARNDIVRAAAMAGGEAWKAAFLPKRFGFYVERKPFPYPGHRLGFFIKKARRMGWLKGLFARHFGGWDPWSTETPPQDKVREFRDRFPGKYKFSRTGMNSGLYADFRANAKRMVREVVEEWESDNKFLPLIESGELRKVAVAGARSTATAKGGAAFIRVKVPFPGGRNPRVAAVIRTIPQWEVVYVVKAMARDLAKRLESASPTSTSIGPSAPRALYSQGGMRSPGGAGI